MKLILKLNKTQLKALVTGLGYFIENENFLFKLCRKCQKDVVKLYSFLNKEMEKIDKNNYEKLHKNT